MAKFKVGDYVEYTNRKYPDGPIRGEIIAIDKGGHSYLVHEDSNRNRHWKSRWAVSPFSEVNLVYFEPSSSSTRLVSKTPCFHVDLGVRNIKNMEIPYDPSQMPDEEDDI